MNIFLSIAQNPTKVQVETPSRSKREERDENLAKQIFNMCSPKLQDQIKKEINFKAEPKK